MNPKQENKDDSTVDVVIPVYNGEKFISDALNSVIGQTYQPDKVIVVDDGSTDRTGEIVAGIGRTSPVQIEYIRKENGGPSSARNAGILASTADFIALLDADDVWDERKLELQLAVMKGSPVPNVGIVYCDYSLMDESGRDVDERRLRSRRLVRGDIYRRLLKGNIVAGSDSAVLIRRECLDETGFFEESIMGEDWDLWLRIAKRYGFDFVGSTLVRIRIHEDSVQHDASVDRFRMHLAFYRKWSRLLSGENQSCPMVWSWWIARRIAASLPDEGLLSAARETLSSRETRHIFRSFLGSLNLAVASATVAGVFIDSARFLAHNPSKPFKVLELLFGGIAAFPRRLSVVLSTSKRV